MSISKRFLSLLLLGVFLEVFALLFGYSLLVFILYNLVIFILLIVDYFILPDESYLEVKRSSGEKLSLFQREEISFEVYNRGSKCLYLELIDEIPDYHFQAEDTLMAGFVGPNQKKHFRYYLIPTKRGAFEFGKLHLRYRGRFSLCTRNFQVDLSREYKVYPNLQNLQKYRLRLFNNKIFKNGKKNLRLPGNGTSFESLREYVSGDDYRKINWKATARVNKPIINQYQPEKNQHVYLFIDTGRPMSYTVNGYRKLDLAVNTALVLSDMINQNGDLSGVLLFNTTVDELIMPGKGVEHRKKVMESLYHIEYTNYTSNYSEVFQYFKRKERHRSIIFLFTDFETEDETEEILRVMPFIARNNLVVILLLENQSLKDIKAHKAGNNQELFNKGVAIELLNERHRIINLLNYRGVFCLECPAEKLEYMAINKYIELKSKSYFS
jgi:uncharacterized protein (DUF58 family)